MKVRRKRGRTDSLVVEESSWGGRGKIDTLVGIEISKFYCCKGSGY